MAFEIPHYFLNISHIELDESVLENTVYAVWEFLWSRTTDCIEYILFLFKVGDVIDLKSRTEENWIHFYAKKPKLVTTR